MNQALSFLKNIIKFLIKIILMNPTLFFKMYEYEFFYIIYIPFFVAVIWNENNTKDERIKRNIFYILNFLFILIVIILIYKNIYIPNPFFLTNYFNIFFLWFFLFFYRDYVATLFIFFNMFFSSKSIIISFIVTDMFVFYIFLRSLIAKDKEFEFFIQQKHTYWVKYII